MQFASCCLAILAVWLLACPVVAAALWAAGVVNKRYSSDEQYR